MGKKNTQGVIFGHCIVPIFVCARACAYGTISFFISQFEGDIRVLYTTTVQRAPLPKKRGSKDLQVKPGESIDVIQNVDDMKLLCRNEEGKCKLKNNNTWAILSMGHD